MYSGFNGKGEWYQLFQIGFGGIPGRPAGDGPDGHSLWPAFTNVPNEFLEAYFPLRILAYATIPDSGGAGLHRGGNGITIAYELLEAGEILDPRRSLVHLSLGRQRRRCPACARPRQLVRKNGGDRKHPLEMRPHPCRARRRAAFQHLGRRRLGRSAEARGRESGGGRARGLVTAKGARRYGVVRRRRRRASTRRATERLRQRHGGRARADARCSIAASSRSRNCARAARRKPASTRRKSRASAFDLSRRRGIGGRSMSERDGRGSGSRNYARAGYHAAQLWGRRPALILIDFAQAYFDPTAPLFGGDGCRTALASALAPARDRARGRHSGDPHRSDLSQGRRRRRRLLPQGAAARPASSRAARPSASPMASSPRDDEFVVTKQYPSAFFGTSLAATLTAAGVDTLVITGLTTSGCVRATCVDSMSHGFITLVAREAVGDRDPRPHEANLYDMNAKYADVVSEATAADYFRVDRQLARSRPDRGQRRELSEEGAVP